MGGFIKFVLGFCAVYLMINDLDSVPAWAQLIAYSLVVTGYVMRKDD